MVSSSRAFTTVLCGAMAAGLSWSAPATTAGERGEPTGSRPAETQPEAGGPAIALDRGGPERSGSVSGGNLPRHPVVLWSRALPSDPGEPVLAEGMVYVGDSTGSIFAIDVTDGSLRWRFANRSQIFRAPALRGDTLYFTSKTGLHALSRMKGRSLWTCGGVGDATGSSPLITGDRIVVAGTNGMVSAVDLDGVLLWQHDIAEDAPPSPPRFDAGRARGGNGKARPVPAASDGTTIYQPIFDQSRVAAIDLKSGRRRWSFQARGWIFASPVVDDGRVYFGSQDCSFYCLDKRRKSLIWSFPTKSRIEAGAAVRDGSVFFGSCDGRFYRLNAWTGDEVWSYQTPIAEGASRAIYASPIATEDAVYFGSFDGHVYCLGIEKGDLRWRIRVASASEITGGLLTDGRRIMVAVRRNLQGSGGDAIVAIGDERDRPPGNTNTP